MTRERTSVVHRRRRRRRGGRGRRGRRGWRRWRATKAAIVASNGGCIPPRCIVHPPPAAERVHRDRRRSPSPTSPAACNKDTLHDNAPAATERATVDTETEGFHPWRKPSRRLPTLPFPRAARDLTFCIPIGHCSPRV